MHFALRSAVCVLTVVLFVGLTGRNDPLPTRLSAGDTAPPAPARPSRTSLLYNGHCVGCHGSDGSARRFREFNPETPDFTRPDWHDRRTNVHLLTSILEGKGNEMPGYQGKIDRKDAEQLVVYVRAFNPRSKTAADKTSGADDFAQQLRKLQDEMKALKKTGGETPTAGGKS
jgi:mono/diheme cytochrome c family protein